MPPILEKYNQRKLLIFSAFLASISFVAFSYTNSIILSVLILTLAQGSLHANYSALIVLFKDSTRTVEEFTKDTGLLGSFNNLGWFVGPMLGGLALGNYGFKGLFTLAGSLTLIGGLYVLLFPFKTMVKHRRSIDGDIKANIRYYLSSKHLRISYLQKLGVELWWGVIWTFIPIFMLKGGYSSATIGLFLSLTQLPLFLFEFKTVGFVAKYGFKKIFTYCYIGLTLICLLSFFTLSSQLAVVLALILAGSLALSFLEPITDLFFFSRLSILEEEKAYPTYSTAEPVGSMLAKIIPGISLALFYDKAIFIILGISLFFIATRAFAIRG
ncbi:MAG TPA: MFS transporter, partial [Candidatus Saccharimonadales bacterium]|nr:MFS transporter [Candidatus Saccharimonadales bacterium]